MDMINYEYYKIFYYVGKYKSITKAAQMLYSSQPAVTRIIQKLENELECKLFVRSQAGMDFTQEGKTLFDYVSIAYNQLERGEDEIRRCAVGETGTIYIGASVTSLHVFLFDALDLFHSRYPNVRLKILTGSNNGTLEKLKNGLVHLAFVSTPFNASGAFKISRIKKFHDILIVGKDFDDLRGKTLSVQDLIRYPFVCLRHGMQLRKFIDDRFAERNLIITPDAEADGADLLVPMIQHNLGLGFVPEAMAEDAVGRGEVFRIPLTEELPARYICMLYNPCYPQSTASEELIREIQKIPDEKE